jgi:hypothetical protein
VLPAQAAPAAVSRTPPAGALATPELHEPHDCCGDAKKTALVTFIRVRYCPSIFHACMPRHLYLYVDPAFASVLLLYCFPYQVHFDKTMPCECMM